MIERPRTLRFRFSIGTIMLITVVFGVMAAAGRQFVRAVHQGTSPRALFVIFTLAAPMIVLVVLSLICQVTGWLGPRASRDLHDRSS